MTRNFFKLHTFSHFDFIFLVANSLNLAEKGKTQLRGGRQKGI
jgi:hypothetical protein